MFNAQAKHATMPWVAHIRHENIHNSLPREQGNGSLRSRTSEEFLVWFGDELH